MEPSIELSPYLLGPYAPIEDEIDRDALTAWGEIPPDLEGVVVRNGPNPRFSPKGRYHWFDGDGMLHAVEIRGGKARYRNRYVRTPHLAREIEAGRPLWSGVMESIRDNPRDAPYKDTANTDVLFFGGELVALWYVSGTPQRLDPITLATRGPLEAGGRPTRMAAHGKVDPKTGELFFFDFGFEAPFMRFGAVAPDRSEARTVPIELPGPRLPHDLAITEHHAILMDLPVVYDPEGLKRNRWVTRFDRALPARFAVLPKNGGAADLRWFEAEPCYIYHVVNAWEEDDAIVMVACRVEDPIPQPDPKDGMWAQMLANLRVRARLWRWRFDLRTGRTKEEPIDDLNTDFPAIDARLRGRRSRASYHVRLAAERTIRFDALVKYDVDTGRREVLELGSGRYGSEAQFAPRVGSIGEDDGYLLSFVHDLQARSSELWIIDARSLASGPIARIALPQRVPLGFHGCFVPNTQLASDGGAR